MALSGHRDISMLKRYSHTQKDAKRAAIKKLEGRYIKREVNDVELETSMI